MKDRAEIASDADDDGGGGEDVLHIFGETGDVSAPWAHGGAGEGISSAGMGERGGHFGDGEAEAGVHRGHDDEGGEHAGEPSRGESKIPAEEIPGDDGGYAEGPQVKDAGVAAEGAFFEVLAGGFRVDGQGLHFILAAHGAAPLGTFKIERCLLIHATHIEAFAGAVAAGFADGACRDSSAEARPAEYGGDDSTGADRDVSSASAGDEFGEGYESA